MCICIYGRRTTCTSPRVGLIFSYLLVGRANQITRKEQTGEYNCPTIGRTSTNGRTMKNKCWYTQ